MCSSDLLWLQKGHVFKGLFEQKYVFAIVAFMFMSTASVILFSYLTDKASPLIVAEDNNKNERQVELRRLEIERDRQAAIIKENAERERIAAEHEERESRERMVAENAEREWMATEKERLALVMREKTKKIHKMEQNISRLVVSAESLLSKNRLKDAYGSFQKILEIDVNNKAAMKGINRVAEKYLALAVSKAEKHKFDTAEAYVQSASRISPQHPQLAATQQTIFELKNKQLAAKEKQQSQSRDTPVKPQAEVQAEAEQAIPKQRVFGGF